MIKSLKPQYSQPIKLKQLVAIMFPLLFVFPAPVIADFITWNGSSTGTGQPGNDWFTGGNCRAGLYFAQFLTK